MKDAFLHTFVNLLSSFLFPGQLNALFGTTIKE
jgi:hypothetical protein